MPELNDFEGRWRMTRRIEDARAGGGSGLFDGIAVFAPVGGGLAYAEAGELRLPDQAGLRAERRYLWRAAGAGVDVCFEDGSDFHHINLSRKVATAWHECLPDFYEVSYNFSHWTSRRPEWRAIWRVQGPAKDYTMITDYRR